MREVLYIMIKVLNMGSLLKHSVDIKFNGNINDSDLLLLTETQLLPQTDDREIGNNLPYTLQRQDHAFDKFCCLAPRMKSIMFKLDNMNIFQF